MMPEGQKGSLGGKRKEPEEGRSWGKRCKLDDRELAGETKAQGELSRRAEWQMTGGRKRRGGGHLGGSIEGRTTGVREGKELEESEQEFAGRRGGVPQAVCLMFNMI